VHISISWVLDLRIKDYKYNDTGATKHRGIRFFLARGDNLLPDGYSLTTLEITYSLLTPKALVQESP
jgi:hypothetical protein